MDPARNWLSSRLVEHCCAHPVAAGIHNLESNTLRLHHAPGFQLPEECASQGLVVVLYRNGS